MKRFNFEFVVGLFVLAALVLLAHFSIQIGSRTAAGRGGYRLTALFSNVSGLKRGSNVVIAGVPVGRVSDLSLKDYQANVEMEIEPGTAIQEDAIASVKTQGLLGTAYVDISPGASDVVLKAGERIRETEPVVDIQSLIAKYVFSTQEKKGDE